jgi:hypothetical protein
MRLAVAKRDAIDVAARLQREVGHVQGFANQQVGGERVVRAPVVGHHLAHQRERELVVARWHRRVRREHASALDVGGDFTRHHGHPPASHFLEAELQHERGRVSLVHVEAPELVQAERAKNAHATDAEQQFLAQPVAQVAAVQMVGQSAVRIGVCRHVGVEKQDGHDVSADAGHLVAPRPQLDGAPLDADGDPRRQFGQPIGGRPIDRLLALPAVGAELLAKVAAPVDECDGDHVEAAVGRGTDGVAGEDAESARVGRKLGRQADLHREVGDRGRAVHAGQRWESASGPKSARERSCLAARGAGSRRSMTMLLRSPSAS